MEHVQQSVERGRMAGGVERGGNSSDSERRGEKESGGL